MTQYLSFLGWGFLPGIVSTWVQTVYYGVTIRAGDAKPAPGSARFNADRRKIQIAVVCLYLAYTVYEADYELLRRPSYYTELGLPFDATEKDVKSRYRRVAALHHPDKGGSASGDYFIHLKLAAETLQDEAKRFAYERFGPDVGAWQRCVTIREYVSRGVLQGVLARYAVAAAMLYAISVFGYMNFGTYYRWLMVASLCTFELFLTTRPHFPAFLGPLNAVLTTLTPHPPLLPYQVIALARSLSITVYIGLAQLGPLLYPDQKGTEAEKALSKSMDRLEGLIKQVDADSTRLVDMETAPFKGDATSSSNLQGKMKEWLVQNTIRADPMVKDAVGTSFRKRRMNAPAGARGNR